MMGPWVRVLGSALLAATFIAPVAAADSQVRLRQDRGLHLGQLKKGTDPAFARGYADGYREGADDAKRHAGYDPVDSRDYRAADQGYSASYGSRDAYKNNYRAGFRQGYEDGYRERR
jgi:flagellar biosynthesis/type III secretory pathway protein FliH